MATVQGVCPTKFAAVKALLESRIASADELGAAITVSVHGEEVLDIWGGYADVNRTELWEKDTLVNVWSSTKTVAALAVLMLISQGKLDAFEKVSTYWPEFAANGKQDVEVRHFLSHSSGVSGWEKPITIEEVCDLKGSTERLAAQAPWWTPGEGSGYHAVTMGQLLGELVRRASGKSLTRFVAEDIAAPLDADFHIGASEKDWARIANVTPPPGFDLAALDQESVGVKTLTGPLMDALVSATPMWRKAELGAVNGHGNARSLNRTAGVVTLGGTVQGREFLNKKTMDLIFNEQSDGPDRVLGQRLRFGVGYGLRAEDGGTEWLPKGKVCFWGGWGGSIVLMDVERGITLTYVMNKMGEGTLGSKRTHAYVYEIYKALGDDTVGIPWV